MCEPSRKTFPNSPTVQVPEQKVVALCADTPRNPAKPAPPGGTTGPGLSTICSGRNCLGAGSGVAELEGAKVSNGATAGAGAGAGALGWTGVLCASVRSACRDWKISGSITLDFVFSFFLPVRVTPGLGDFWIAPEPDGVLDIWGTDSLNDELRARERCSSSQPNEDS